MWLGLYNCDVYLDLQKRFDTINQNILLPKLKHYGHKGTCFGWLKSFICDGVQYTPVDLKESSTKILSHAVTQSSVLDLLLLIVLIKALNKSVKNSKVHHYAENSLKNRKLS